MFRGNPQKTFEVVLKKGTIKACSPRLNAGRGQEWTSCPPPCVVRRWNPRE
jgi:hypothetical protein